MALGYKGRKRVAYLILLVGLPVYIGLIVGVMGLVYDRFGQLPILLELVLYCIFGIAWVFPVKSIFRGAARPDPDAPPED